MRDLDWGAVLTALLLTLAVWYVWQDARWGVVCAPPARLECVP